MRRFPRLIRVPYGTLGRRPLRILILLEQNDRALPRLSGFSRDLGRRAPLIIYCASVSPILR
jgi:hypothetical protein